MKMLGYIQATAIGIAGNAPTYSIAVALAGLISATGAAAPLAMIYCGFIVWGIVISYGKLNIGNPNYGAAYKWVWLEIHPVLGFFTGWCLLVASLIFMISTTLPAARASISLFNADLSNDKSALLIVAVLWMGFVSTLLYRGVDIVGKFQTIFTFIDLSVLLSIPIILFSGETFSFANISANVGQVEIFSFKFLSDGLILALFFYWGWDVIFNLAVETNRTEVTSAKSAYTVTVCMVFLLSIYALLGSSSVTEIDIKDAGDNMIFALAKKSLPEWLQFAAIIGFLLSTIGAMSSSLIQFAETVSENAKDGIFSTLLSRRHKKYNSPHFAILLIFSVVALLLSSSLFYSSFEDVVSGGIGASSILIAYYYSCAGVACGIVNFKARKNMGFGDQAIYIAWPLVSATAFALAGALSLFQFGLLSGYFAAISVILGIAILIGKRKLFIGHSR